MPMEPIAVDTGAIFKQKAVERTGKLAAFAAEADTHLTEAHEAELKAVNDSFTAIAEDGKDFFPKMNELATKLAGLGVDKEHLAVHLYGFGFGAAMQVMQNGMQAVPDFVIRAYATSYAKEHLAPEAEDHVKEEAEGMKHNTDLPNVPTEEEFKQSVETQLEGIKDQLRGRGMSEEEVEQFVSSNVRVPTYDDLKTRVEAQRGQIEARTQQAKEQSGALDKAGVPEGEKAGSLVLTGYMAGNEVIQEQLAKQRAFMEMMQKMMAAQQGGEEPPAEEPAA